MSKLLDQRDLPSIELNSYRPLVAPLLHSGPYSLGPPGFYRVGRSLAWSQLFTGVARGVWGPAQEHAFTQLKEQPF